jgi:uncharacterized protein YggT (Ycf19 family)
LIANNQNRSLIIFTSIVVALLVILVLTSRVPQNAPDNKPDYFSVPLTPPGSQPIKLRVLHAFAEI